MSDTNNDIYETVVDSSSDTTVTTISLPKSEWTIRRRIIYGILAFCALCILWILLGSDNRPVAEMIIMCAFGLGSATISSYIFGAVWDDNNYMNTLKRGN